MTDYEYDKEFWQGTPRFIILEGDEGAGKSTQIALLHEWMTDVLGLEVSMFREPGTGSLASRLRALLLDPETADMSTYEEALLMTAARIDTRSRHVMPALAEGKWVLCDRGELSSIIYQGFARDECAMVFVKKLQDEIRAVVPRAELYVVISVPTALSEQRMNKERDRFELAPARFRERINRGFQMIETLVAGEYRVAHVDGSPAIEVVTQSLVRAIEASF